MRRFFVMCLGFLLALGLIPMQAGAADSVAINEANFPDPAFREYLLQQDYGTDGVLTQTELDVITSMVVSDMGILDLKGIEFFSQLVFLNCSYNQLSSLDVSGNIYLSTLFCFENQLSSLDVSANQELDELSCWGNQQLNSSSS